MQLPYDITYEILIRTDAQMHHALRCVCKEWRGLFSDPNFLKEHHQMSKRFRGCIFALGKRNTYISHSPDPYLPQSCVGPLPSLDFLPTGDDSWLCILASTTTADGLLLCLNRGRGKLDNIVYICKPTTREWIQIPEAYQSISKWDFYFVEWFVIVAPAAPLRFKIGRITPLKDGNYALEVFDSNSWGQWKEVGCVNPFLRDHVSFTVVNGTLCFLCKVDQLTRVIICFDMWTETMVSRISLPPEINHEIPEGCTKVSNIDGRLGVIREGRSSEEGSWVISFWCLKSWFGDDEEKWEKDGELHLRIFSFWPLLGSPSNSPIVDGLVPMWVEDSSEDGDYILRWYNYKEDNYKNSAFRFPAPTLESFFSQSDYIPCSMNQWKHNIY